MNLLTNRTILHFLVPPCCKLIHKVCHKSMAIVGQEIVVAVLVHMAGSLHRGSQHQAVMHADALERRVPQPLLIQWPVEEPQSSQRSKAAAVLQKGRRSHAVQHPTHRCRCPELRLP